MDKAVTPSERIKRVLTDDERSKAWLARNTQIPLTTLDRKLRGDGNDFTLAQIHAISEALGLQVVDFVPSLTDVAAS